MMRLRDQPILVVEPFTASLPGGVYHLPSFQIDSGEALALFGFSETNPSLLLQVLAGQIPKDGFPLPPEPGQIRQRREFIDLSNWPMSLMGKRLYDDPFAFQNVGVVYSDPDQGIIGRTVLEDYWNALVAVGGEPDRQEAAIKLRPYALEDKLDRKTQVLSGGERQRLTCATALAGAPSLIVADLTAANLDHDFLHMFVEWMNDHCKNGGGLIIAGLRPDQLSLLPDAKQTYCTVRTIDGGMSLFFENPDENVFPQLAVEEARLTAAFIPRSPGEEILSVRNVRWPHVTLPVSFSLGAKEVVRLLGFNGSGKTTLGNIIVGRRSSRSVEGELHLVGRARPAMSLQFPDRAILGSTLQEEMPDGELLELCGLRGFDCSVEPRKLPYSKRKLLTIATALRASEGLAVLDEPTCGMDHEDKIGFIKLLNHFGDLAIIVITHDSSLNGIGRKIMMGET